jgi:hypothetical protein
MGISWGASMPSMNPPRRFFKSVTFTFSPMTMLSPNSLDKHNMIGFLA